MKIKLLALMLVAGWSMFAESHFSVIIVVGPGYYPSPPPLHGVYQRRDLYKDSRGNQHV